MIDRLLSRRARRLRSRAIAALGRADQVTLRFLRTRGHGPVAERATKSLAAAGEHGAVWAAIGAAGALADPRRRRRWTIAGATAPAAIAINFAVKVAVGRRRPLIRGHPRLARAPSELSFPSAHATSSLAGAIALGRVEPRLRPPLLVLAAGICASRPYLGMHYPSDVLAGAALGIVIGRAVRGVGSAPEEERLIDLLLEANGGRERERPTPSTVAGAAERRA